MKEQLLELLEEIQPYEEINYETRLFEEDILDSVEFAEFLVAIEETFEIDIPEDKINMESFSTVIEIENLLKSLGK